MKNEVTLPNRIAIFIGSIFLSALPLVFEYWALVPTPVTISTVKATFKPILSDLDVLSVIISFSFNVIIQQIVMPQQRKKSNTPSVFTIWVIYFVLMIVAYTVGAVDDKFLGFYQSSYICNLIFGGLSILFCVIYFLRIAYIRKHTQDDIPVVQELRKFIERLEASL